MKKLWLSIIVLVCLPSCMTEDEAFPEAELVVEGWIEEDGYPVVYLGESRPPQETDEVDIRDYIVRWGIVTISDGTNTVTLTGTYTSDAYHPYRYESFNIKGEAGKTYRLKAEYNGRSVTAVTTIPAATALDSVRIIKSDNDTLYSLKAYFVNSSPAENYYALFSRRRHNDPDFLLSFMGVVNCGTTAGKIAADVFRGSSMLTEQDKKSTIYFASGDTVDVKLCRMDRTSYQFWDSYSNLQNLSTNMFFPYTNNLQSNIAGGKGYWCGYGTSSAMVIIP